MIWKMASMLKYFSKSAPNYSNGDYKFNSLNFQLSHNSKLEPSTDLELLIFLWFYCPDFNNNDCAYKKSNADFTFVIPSDDVESKWDKISARRKFEDELLIEETRVSFENIKGRDALSPPLFNKLSYLYNRPHCSI